METVRDFISLGSKITADCDCSHEIKTLALWKESYDKPRQCIKKQRHHFANRSPYSQSHGFFQQSCMDVRGGPKRRLSAKELMLSNRGAWRRLLKESFGQQGDQTSQS